jgi:phosphatidylglycerophosphatase A
MRKLFLTFFYLGLIPKAPGTFGTIGGLLSGILILYFFPVNTLATLLVAVSIVAVFETDKYEKQTNLHDPKEIVIDEVVGIWLVMCAVPFDAISLMLGFIFFRAYDILKPSFIGRVDRNIKGGLGVVADDLLAGFMAAITTLLVINLFSLLTS